MINLLGKERKQSLQAARDNTLLLQYLGVLLFIVTLLSSATLFGYYTLDKQQQAYNDIIDAQKPEKTKYKQDIELAESYKKDLAAAKTIIQNEIKYSDMLIILAKTIPKNTNLISFQATTTTLKKPITVTLDVPTYDAAVVAKDSLLESDYFTGAKLLTVDKTVSEDRTGYAATVVLSLNIPAFIDLKNEGA